MKVDISCPLFLTAVLYLVVVHGNIELIVKFKSQTPDHSSEPKAVVGVHWLCLRSNVQDVLPLVQGSHILTYTGERFSYRLFINCVISMSYVAICCHKMSLEVHFNKTLLTSVCDQEDGIFIQRLQPLLSHLKAKLLNHIQSHLT